MKVSTQNAERSKWCKKLMDFLEESGEDVGFISSNVFNLPTTTEEGEEYEIEITVKIPKVTDDGDDYFSKRESYRIKVEEKAQKEAEKAKAKAKKIAKDKKAREEKKKKE